MSAPPAGAPTGTVDFQPALAVADAVLYEGYLLYPYRRSSAKNRVRWQFGVLAPKGWAERNAPAGDGISGSAESWWSRTDCLLEARPGTTVELRLRFLQLQAQAAAGGADEAFDQAVAHEVDAAFVLGELAEGGTSFSVHAPEAVTGGRVARAVDGCVTAGAVRVPGPAHLYRVQIRVDNTVADLPATAPRPEALRRAMVATHLLLGVPEGAFLSAIDPPEWATPAAQACRNVRTFPVLAGPPGTSRLLLSAPIILPDHPRVAPESPGDLFDATEIDEILSLRTLTLTDEEKAEARATDPRAAGIVDRVDAMPPEILGRLHGAIRSLRPVADPGPGPGSRVRLRPRRRGTDAQDMFLAGRLATVDSVLTDVDGTRFLAVSLDDDPRAQLGAGPGRLLHFTPEEVERLA